jgi:hypothetical protein
MDIATAVSQRGWLQQHHWKCLFVDELQAIPNLCCPTLFWLDTLNAKRRFLMSHGAINTNAWSLTSLVHFIYPSLLASLSPLGWWFSPGNAAVMAAVHDSDAGVEEDVVVKMQQLLNVCTLNTKHSNWDSVRRRWPANVRCDADCCCL